MAFEEVKTHFRGGKLRKHYWLNDSSIGFGEYRDYYANGQLWEHTFLSSGHRHGEVKIFNYDGTLFHHYLVDGDNKDLATVIFYGDPSTHTEEELIEIAKEHNLPLLSDIPKTEAELTHWNLKHPDMPFLPIEST